MLFVAVPPLPANAGVVSVVGLGTALSETVGAVTSPPVIVKVSAALYPVLPAASLCAARAVYVPPGSGLLSTMNQLPDRRDAEIDLTSVPLMLRPEYTRIVIVEPLLSRAAGQRC